MNTDELFERMGDIDIVQDYIDALNPNDMEEADNTNMSVAKECLQLLIARLEECGIEFYCTDDELFSNFRDAQFIVDLYKHFRPDVLVDQLDENKDFNRLVRVLITDNVHNSLFEMLKLFADIETSDPFMFDRFMYLHDKVASNETFNEQVAQAIASKRTTDSLPTNNYLKLFTLINKQRDCLRDIVIEAQDRGQLEDFGGNEFRLMQTTFRSTLLRNDDLDLILIAPPKMQQAIVGRISDTSISQYEEVSDYIIFSAIINRVSNHYLFGTSLEVGDDVEKMPGYEDIKELALSHLPKDSYVNADLFNSDNA